MLQQRPPFPSGIMDCILPKDLNQGALYLSGIEAALNPYLLQQNQIGAILTVGQEMSNLQFQDANHKVLYLNDTSHDPIKKYFDESIQFISENRKQCNVLVHCFVGVSRSATIIIAYLMEIYNYTLQQSLQYLISIRPLINPNPGFMQQLQHFDQELLRKRLSLLRPYSQESKRPQSVHGRRKESITTYRQSQIQQSPLKQIKAPGQQQQNALMMTPLSIRKLDQNNKIRQCTPNIKENFCKSLNSSINSGDFKKVLQQCNQYHSAKKTCNDSTNFLKQAAIFCKTYSSNQTQQNTYTGLIKAPGSGLGITQQNKLPIRLKGTVFSQ